MFNLVGGEGGAGTFSDGKLTTRVTHPRLHEISKYFVEFGAPEEILYKHKPHVGTDKLRHMVKPCVSVLSNGAAKSALELR